MGESKEKRKKHTFKHLNSKTGEKSRFWFRRFGLLFSPFNVQKTFIIRLDDPVCRQHRVPISGIWLC